MAAGLGFKTFTTGEVLTAADTNGYLMQGILVFATEAARNSAITSPQEGQFAFTKDTNSLWYYSGTAWVASGATGDIEGVTAGIGISGGGTSGTVTVTNSMATAIDAKGDLVAGTGADAFSRLAVGSNNTVLTADSAEATGLKWATASAGGMTLIASGTLSGASVSITSIPSTYVNLVLYLNNPYIASGTSFLRLRVNSGTSTYGRWFVGSGGATGGDGAAQSAWNIYDGTNNNLRISSTDYSSASVTLWNYADTSSQKSMSYQFQDRVNTFSSIGGTGGTAISNTSVVSSVQIITDASTFAGGTYILYGVK